MVISDRIIVIGHRAPGILSAFRANVEEIVMISFHLMLIEIS